jgi:hypothetical protein
MQVSQRLNAMKAIFDASTAMARAGFEAKSSGLQASIGANTECAGECR